MKLFPRWHTPESVAKQLIEGLENGTYRLDAQPGAEDLIADIIALTAEIDAGLVRLIRGHSPLELPTVEQWTEYARRRPGAAHDVLNKLRGMNADLNAVARLKRKATTILWKAFFFLITQAVTIIYLYLTAPTPVFFGYLLTTVVAVTFVLRPQVRARLQAKLDAHTKLLSALAELARQVRAVAEPRTSEHTTTN
jgi:hypothetical protein